MNEATDEKSYFIPYEVVTIILGHLLPCKTIIQSRLVCRTWNHIVVHESWKYVVKIGKSEGKPYTDAEIEKISQMPWYLLHAMCAEDGIFGRNLVMTKHRSGNPVWKLTDPDSPCWQTVASDVKNESKLNDELSNTEEFFTCKIQVGKLQTSTRTVQVIKLPKSGLSWLIIKTLRPEIHVSFWVCLEAGLEAPIDRQERPRYHAIVHLRNSALELINTATSHDRSNLIINTAKGTWKKITLAKQQASEMKPHLDSIFIEHLLHNSEAKCVVTRMLIRIEKPNFLNVNWNLILKNGAKENCFKMLPISDYSTLVEKAATKSLNTHLLSAFDTHVELLAYPASGDFIPEVWYGRPLADVITIKDDDVDASSCYDSANHLLLYELKYKIHLKEHGLFGFIMDELQPSIVAYVDYHVSHRDKMKYEMTASLLDSEGKVLQQKKGSQVLSKLHYSKELSLKFKEYGKGVRYIVIEVRRHMTMNKCTQVVHGPLTFTFLNHVRSVVNVTKVLVSHG